VTEKREGRIGESVQSYTKSLLRIIEVAMDIDGRGGEGGGGGGVEKRAGGVGSL